MSTCISFPTPSHFRFYKGSWQKKNKNFEIVKIDFWGKGGILVWPNLVKFLFEIEMNICIWLLNYYSTIGISHTIFKLLRQGRSFPYSRVMCTPWPTGTERCDSGIRMTNNLKGIFKKCYIYILLSYNCICNFLWDIFEILHNIRGL